MREYGVYAAAFRYGRRLLQLNQAQMARRLGVNQSTVSRIENGTHSPRRGKIELLEKMTGKSVSALSNARSIYTIDRKAIKREANDTVYQQGRKARLEDINDEGRKYLKNRWHTEIVDIQRQIDRKQYELNKHRHRREVADRVFREAENILGQQRRLFDYLQTHKAPDTLLNPVRTGLEAAVLQVQDARSRSIMLLTPYEIMVRQSNIDTLQLRKTYLQKQVETLEKDLEMPRL